MTRLNYDEITYLDIATQHKTKRSEYPYGKINREWYRKDCK